MALSLSRTGLPAELRYPLLTASERLEPLVEAGQQVARGTPLADGTVRCHAAAAGVVRGPCNRASAPFPGAAAVPTLVIETTTDDQIAAVALRSSATSLADRVRDAGIAGLGGAGYPAWKKLEHAAANSVHTVLVNAAECEPGVSADEALLEHHAAEVLRGALLVAEAIAAERVVVGIEAGKRDAIRKLRSAAEQTAPRARRATPIDVVSHTGSWTSGAERDLVRLATGIEIPPQQYPTQAGVLVFNVATLFAIHRAADHDEPLTERVVTVAGENCWVRIGHPLAALGGNRLGGAATGFLAPPDAVVCKTSHAVGVRPRDAAHACINCGKCANDCPVGLLPQVLQHDIAARRYDAAAALGLDQCIECGACVAVCPSHIPLLDYFRHGKSTLAGRAAANARADLAKRHFEAHSERLANRTAEVEQKRSTRLQRLRNKRRWR